MTAETELETVSQSLDIAKKPNIELAVNPLDEPLRGVETTLLTVPTSVLDNLAMEVMAAGRKVADLPARKGQVSKGTKYAVFQDGISRKVTILNPNSQVALTVSDINLLTGTNGQARRFFVLVLMITNEQAVINGQLVKNTIHISPTDLIEKGLYTTRKGAKYGIKRGVEVITNLKFEGKIRLGKDFDRYIKVGSPIFSKYFIDPVTGECDLVLESGIDWGFLASYYTFVPTYYFTVSLRTSDLTYYIFYLARQHLDDLAGKDHCFYISYKAIQHRLMLPSEKGAANPKRDIREVIERVIDEIEEAHRKTYDNTDLQLLPLYKGSPDIPGDDLPISDYVENMELKVTLEGKFLEWFMNTRKRFTRKAASSRKKG